MITNCDNDFDKLPNLSWYPFIGDNYLTSSNKLLLVGESHYYNPMEKGSYEKHQSKSFTRVVIEKVAIGKEYKQYEKRAARIFPNIHFTFLGNDNSDSEPFWNKLAYYNFIQKVMKTNQERPTKVDYIKAWENFDDIINVIKPDTCIFLGNSASKYFPVSFKSGIKITCSPKDDGWVNNSASKKAIITLKNEQLITLLFIRHPSNYYSWKEWESHLIKKNPDLMTWLKIGDIRAKFL